MKETVLFDINKLGTTVKGKFIRRINRFVGEVLIGNSTYSCHIADTGRLKELLTYGREALLLKNPENLKTDYKLVAVKVNESYILLNTSYHSKIAEEAIKKGILDFIPKSVQKEVKFNNSRLDFLVNENTYIELKGSNLLIGERCLFPDAPTTRGRRHLEELISARGKGFNAIILIMALRDCNCFYPNKITDPDFFNTFFNAIKSGVKPIIFRVKINKSK